MITYLIWTHLPSSTVVVSRLSIRGVRRAAGRAKSIGLLFVLLSCAKDPASTGGVQVEEVEGIDGRSCGRGLAVVMTDYASTNVALLDLTGSTLIGSFLSSASAETKLNAPLSGDVGFPSSRMVDELILIDAYPASVITFVEIETAEVRAQLSVRTGFNANPQDYLALDKDRAWVTRLESNPRPGSEAFDEGDDILSIDPREPSITKRIDLSAAHEGDRARPGSMARVGDTVFVTLTGHSADFQSAPDSIVAALSAQSGELLYSHVASGMKNCVGLAISPDEGELALSCSGIVQESGDGATPPHSGLILLEIEENGLRERERILAADLGKGPLMFSLAYASPDLLLLGTLGALEGEDAGRPDRILSYDKRADRWETLISSEDRAFNLGAIQCMEACGVCFVADASRELVHRLFLNEAGTLDITRHRIDTDIDLPPRRLGWF